MRNVILSVVVLVGAAVLVAWQLRARSAPIQPPALNGAVSGAPAVAESHENATPFVSVGAQTPSAAAPVSESAGDPKFQSWLHEEARQMDLPQVDSERKEREMARLAARLTPAQSRQLLQTVRNPEAPSGDKILSTYLLVQAGPRAVRELRELIASPVTETGPAHSEAEMNSMRDKTLRIMALDGLSSRAQSDPQARQALAAAIDEIQDPYVKNHARELLAKLQRQ